MMSRFVWFVSRCLMAVGTVVLIVLVSIAVGVLAGAAVLLVFLAPHYLIRHFP